MLRELVLILFDNIIVIDVNYILIINVFLHL